jgi:hypothetical protein
MDNLRPETLELLDQLGVDPSTPEGREKGQQILSAMLARTLPAKMGKPDWKYMDLPHMTHECMRLFRLNIGEENLLWITEFRGEKTQRGQVLISPEGMRRIEGIAEGGEVRD